MKRIVAVGWLRVVVHFVIELDFGIGQNFRSLFHINNIMEGILALITTILQIVISLFVQKTVFQTVIGFSIFQFLAIIVMFDQILSSFSQYINIVVEIGCGIAFIILTDSFYRNILTIFASGTFVQTILVQMVSSTIRI